MMRKNLSITAKVLMSYAGIFGILVIMIYPQTAAAIGLNQNGLVRGEVVTASDVFTGLSISGEKVLGPAPLPGRSMTLDSKTLLRIAIALDLPWRPQTNAERVTLRRAATVVDSEIMKSSLKAAIDEQIGIGKYVLVFDEMPAPMILPEGMEAHADIASLDVRADKNRFSADLVAPSVSNPLVSRRVTGRIERIAMVPVLRETLGRKDIVGANDLELIEIPARELSANVIMKPEQIIGMTPRNTIMPGKPITANMMESPRMVSRGDVVTMVFNAGSMLLTAQGKALEHGAMGDMIRVSNAASNKVITAKISNSREVTLSGGL